MQFSPNKNSNSIRFSAKKCNSFAVLRHERRRKQRNSAAWKGAHRTQVSCVRIPPSLQMKKFQTNTMPPPATMPAIAPAEEIRLGVLVGALAKTAPIAIATRHLP